MDPEGSYMKAPGESEIPLEPFLYVFLELFLLKNANQNSKTKKEKVTMATRKSICVFFGILMISAWVLGSAIQAGAENMNFKLYTYVTKGEIVPIDDVEGHIVNLLVRRSFYAFENGEVAIVNAVITGDYIKGSGTFKNYLTITFPDGSTMIVKGEGTVGGTAGGALASGGWKSEIIKGTGRFVGIKGSLTSKAKYLPVEKGEAGAKGYGEGTITYTLPPK